MYITTIPSRHFYCKERNYTIEWKPQQTTPYERAHKHKVKFQQYIIKNHNGLKYRRNLKSQNLEPETTTGLLGVSLYCWRVFTNIKCLEVTGGVTWWSVNWISCDEEILTYFCIDWICEKHNRGTVYNLKTCTLLLFCRSYQKMNISILRSVSRLLTGVLLVAVRLLGTTSSTTSKLSNRFHFQPFLHPYRHTNHPKTSAPLDLPWQ